MKQKSLQQRLQSRISIRRNVIRKLERDITMYKDAELYYKAAEIRRSVNILAGSQKLDKQLYAHCLESHRICLDYFQGIADAAFIDMIEGLPNANVIYIDDVEKVG